MTTRAALNARMRKVEQSAIGDRSAEPWVWVITERDDELSGKLAEMEAAGTYRPGQGYVQWRLVAPEPRSTPCRTLT